MSRIYWDTMLFVYLFEEHPVHCERVDCISKAMDLRRDQLCTSVFTLAELLVGPRKRGDADAQASIRRALRPPRVELIPFTTGTAERYSQIRAEHRIKPPDAIHLASAADAGVDLFLTNDRQLLKVLIPGIGFIAGMDVGLF